MFPDLAVFCSREFFFAHRFGRRDGLLDERATKTSRSIAAQLGRSIKRIAMEIAERNGGADNVVLVGIIRRGAKLAERIAAELRSNGKRPVPVGTLDISSYRGRRQGLCPAIHACSGATSHFRSTAKRVVLVDDVLYTGAHGTRRARCYF